MTWGKHTPMIRLEIEGIKRTAITALVGHAEMLQQEIQNAVEDYCTPENLEEIIQRHIREAIDSAIKDEIGNFYRHGDGRAFIRELVQKRLGGTSETN